MKVPQNSASSVVPEHTTSAQESSVFSRLIVNRLKPFRTAGLCPFCQSACLSGQALCEACTRAMPRPQNPCRMCAVELPASQSHYCADCLRQAKPYQQTLVACRYASPVTELVSGYKFHQQFHYGKIMQQLLATRLAEHYAGQPWPEVLIPVPLHTGRLQQRGFNQSLELAKPLAKRFPLALQPDWVTRSKATMPQSELHANARQRNIENAFQVTGKLAARHVAILDDVITTCATVSSLALTLQQAGIQRIDIWAVARVSL